MENSRTKYILLYVLAALPLVVTLFAFNKLPDRIPMHWDVNGNVNGYGDKIPFAFILPLIPLVTPAFMSLMAKMDPQRANYTVFRGSYYIMQLLLVLIFVSLNFITISVALGYEIVKVDTFVKLIIGLLITVIGNLMPKFKHNYFVGIKTPWTLASEEVWFKTHRIGGMLWFFGGILMMALAFVPGRISAVLYIAIVLATSLVSLIYSYIEFNRAKKLK
mgnify:CR=1 FL=1